MVSYFAATAFLPGGWARNVRIETDATGVIGAVVTGAGATGAERLAGPLLPGMPNGHSHAFQRAFAGLAERTQADRDSFWTWRDSMYRFAAGLTPEHIGAIATQLYVEMLKAGYTTVTEFHYLHNTPGGGAYDDEAELSRRVIEAARLTGIAITHLPVLYTQGGFGGLPAEDRQRRFITSPDQLVAIFRDLAADYGGDPLVRIGVAPHSLRAAGPEELAAAVKAVRDIDPEAPIHIHIAEQQREVDECIAWSGKRPVEWLLATGHVDRHWNLVHATHVTREESSAIAESGAVAVLCPTTEANLGDGLFPLKAYLDDGGRIAIGSDSNVSVSVIEELRWLEYGQRLATGSRLIAATEETPSAGASLYRAALAGGARAAAQPVGELSPGHRADFVVLDPDHPGLAAKADDHILDGLVFACSSNPVRDVYVGGKPVIRQGIHVGEEEILSAFRGALASIIDL